MPTIAELEQQLTDAANNSDMGTITSIVSSLTTAEKAAFDPAVFDYALTAVGNYTMTDPAAAAGTVGTFIQEVGLYTDPSAIGQTMDVFGEFGNPAGVVAMVDNMDPQIYPHLDPVQLGGALFGLSFGGFTDPATAVAATADFLSHLSLYTDPFSITNAMVNFAQLGVFDGVNAVVNNIDPQVYSHLDPIMLAGALSGIGFGSFADPAGAIAATANFLSHLSLYTAPDGITGAMQSFLQAGLLDGVRAVVDNTDPQVYAHLDPTALGSVLNGLAGFSFVDPASAAAAAADFVAHLGLYTDPISLSSAMANFGEFGNADGINAIVNNLDPQVYSHLDANELGFALNTILSASFNDPAKAVADVANFLSHLSLYTDPLLISSAMAQFVFSGVLAGVPAMVDNIDPQVYPHLDSFTLGLVLENVADSAFTDVATAVSIAGDFVSHLGPYIDPNAITGAMVAFAQLGGLAGVNALAGVDAIVDNLDPQVYPHLDPGNLGYAMTFIANDTFTLDDHAVAATLGNFSGKLLPFVAESYLEQSLHTLAGDHNLSALNTVLDYTTSAQWDGLSASFKSGLHDLGITVGSYSDDHYNGGPGNDTYFGLGGNDHISGGPGNDVLFGNAGNDTISGGPGNDTLDGGTGNNVLTGGPGSDTFVLETGGVATIVDFDRAHGADTLDFRDILSTYNGSQPITDYIHAQTAGGNTIISFDADGAGPGAAVQVATLQGVTHLDIQALLAQGQILI